MLSILEIAPALRMRGQVTFGDWMIDGVSLLVWIDEHLGSGGSWDVVGLPDDRFFALRMIEMLRRRGEPELASGRAVLYRCPECHDIGCGALAVRVTRDADAVVWSDFAWESDHQAVGPLGGFGLPELRFEAQQYDAVMRRAQKEHRTLA